MLRLYVIGRTKKAKQAIENLERILGEHCPGRFSLEVINLLENPLQAGYDQILITPTVIKLLPPPVTRLAGDFNDKEKVLKALGMWNPEGGEGQGAKGEISQE